MRFALAAAAALSTAAQATIVSSTGLTTVLGSPPSSCVPFALTGPTAFAWDEQQNVAASGVQAEMTTNPSNAPSGAVAGVVSGTFHSHFLHIHTTTSAFTVGTLTFNNPIVAVLYRNTSLDLSDSTFAAFGTTYPTGLSSRGWTLKIGVSVNVNVFKFVVAPSPFPGDIEQFRILTAVPTPGTAALLAAAGVLGIRRRR